MQEPARCRDVFSGFRKKPLGTIPVIGTRLIRPEIEIVEQSLDEVLKLAGLPADRVQAVVRTGGSAEIPAFIRMLGNRFGADSLRPLNPFETIVGGLAIRAAE